MFIKPSVLADMRRDFNKHITIYTFKVLEDCSVMPLKPIAIKNNVGTSFHVEILAPTDIPILAIGHVIDFFERIYPAQRYEMHVTTSEAMKSNYVSACFVEAPKN